jgi:hypothetical protein
MFVAGMANSSDEQTGLAFGRGEDRPSLSGLLIFLDLPLSKETSQPEA